MTANKYLYLYVVQGNYGCGWEDEAASESRKEARINLRAYWDNCSGAYRLIKRREPNPNYRWVEVSDDRNPSD